MNRYRTSAFIRHLVTARSTAGHGVHSPYMFDFITKVIGGSCDSGLLTKVENLRKEMLADRRTVRVTDLGAGPARFSGNLRRISDIAAAASLSGKEVGLLARMAVWTEHRARSREHGAWSMGHGARSVEHKAWGQELPTADCRQPTGAWEGRTLENDTVGHFREEPVCRGDEAWGMEQGAWGPVLETEASRLPTEDCRLETEDCRLKPAAPASGIILELGTSLGISTLAMALATPGMRVVTVEGCPALAEIARANLRKHEAYNAEVLNMEFSDALKKMRTEGTTVSLAFIDGNHRGEALKKYAREIMMMGEEMIIVADDIYMNRDMFTAWQSLAAKETAPAALGTFRLGMLFRIRNLTPGYYRVRY